MDKKELRKQYLKARESLDKIDVQDKSNIIIDKFLKTKWYENAKFIMTYIDFKNEVITRDFISHALGDKKRIVVPITDNKTKTLILSEIKDFNKELQQSSYGILEPKEEYIRIIDSGVLDTILVPGLVFDKRGYRIGYGGGYYDRLLDKVGNTSIAIGVAFDFQLIDRLPEKSYDRQVDYIITDERIII